MGNLSRSLIVWIPLAALAAAPSGALAQGPYGGPGAAPPPAPTVSPYLNLLRRGTSPGVNYYGLVRPEIDLRNAYRGLQQQADLQQLGETTDRRTGLPETGHAAVFLNTQGYFLNTAPSISRRPMGVQAPGGGASQLPARRR